MEAVLITTTTRMSGSLSRRTFIRSWVLALKTGFPFFAVLPGSNIAAVPPRSLAPYWCWYGYDALDHIQPESADRRGKESQVGLADKPKSSLCLPGQDTSVLPRRGDFPGSIVEPRASLSAA